MGGSGMNFFTPINSSSFQSPLGQSPNYNPSSLYLGLLMAITANYYSPFIARPTVSSGISSSIKAYYLEYGSYNGILILNKDTNPLVSGIVSVKMNDPSGLKCMYLSADNLSSTNVTIGNYSFFSGDSAPSGTFYSVVV